MSERPPVDQRRLVLETVDALAPQIVQALSDAVRIPSVNPKYPGQDYDTLVGRESEVNELVAGLHRRAGASVEMVTKEPGRSNAAARIAGSGHGRSLLFNGHVDVVPANPTKWSRDPFSGAVTGTAVHGRGATDDKGGVIASAFAAIALKEAKIRLAGDLVLQSVVGEEVGDHEAGTSAVIAAGYTADAAIVCEPTIFDEGMANVVTTAPGGLWFSLSLEGKASHSGFRGLTRWPTLEGEALGVNAIDKFFPIWSALRELEDRWANYDRHPLFTPGLFSLLPGVVEGHPIGFRTPFATAEIFTAEYAVQHNPNRTNKDVIAEIETVIRNACANDPWLVAHPPVIEWKLEWPPYTMPADNPVLPAITAAHGDAVGGTDTPAPITETGFFGLCDMTWLDIAGINGVVYGPGVGRTCHAEDEYCTIEQLVTATKTYALTAMEFCGIA